MFHLVSMYFSQDIALFTCALLGAALLLTALCSWWLWHRARLVEHFAANAEKREHLSQEELPGVSVIVYAHNDAAYLERFLPLIMNQDYPNFEVIVVDDASYDDSHDVLGNIVAQFNHLYITHLPDNSRSLSRKKLCLMMGIKAAHHDVVLMTNANCRMMSDQWLRLMMRNFIPGVDVVLGYSHYRYHKDRGLGRFYRAFDSVVTSTQWMVSAMKGRPYRGTSDNLAFRKQLFFDNRGFSKNLDLRWGEDDVFVSEIARGDNTRLELASESQVHTYFDKISRAHSMLKWRRDCTSKRVASQVQFLHRGIFSAANYLRLACLAAVLMLDGVNIAVAGAVGLLLALGWGLAILPYNKVAKVLQAPGSQFGIPLFNFWRPVVNLYYRVRSRSMKSSNYISIYD